MLTADKTLSKRAAVSLYRFAYAEGAGLVPMPRELARGPSHSSELPLLFKITDAPLDIYSGKMIERTAAQQQLARVMIGDWVRFANDGALGSGSSGYVLELASTSRYLERPAVYADHECGFWRQLARDQ